MIFLTYHHQTCCLLDLQNSNLLLRDNAILRCNLLTQRTGHLSRYCLSFQNRSHCFYSSFSSIRKGEYIYISLRHYSKHTGTHGFSRLQ